MITVKAISLWEPWASLMRCGAKTIETRGWSTSYRGPLLICGAKRWTTDQYDYLHTDAVQFALAGPRWPRVTPAQEMLLGQAAVLVNLIDCRPTYLIGSAIKHGQELFGDYSHGRFGWITSMRTLLTPFPVRGQQGLFDVTVPPEIEADWPDWARGGA